MKRLSKKARERQARHLKALERRRARESRRRKCSAHIYHSSKGFKKRYGYRPPLAARVVAPEIFSIETDDSRKPVLAFLATLRTKFADDQTKSVLIDFSRTRRFIANGTLLFYAELTRLLQYSAGRVRVRCTNAQNARANQVLAQIGVFSLCGHRPHGKPSLGDVVHWRVASGHLVDNTICAPAIEAFEGKLAEPLVNGIFRGLGEAMTNAKHHAYGGVREDGLNFRQPQQDWWMFSQLRDGVLTVAFCDLGVGIPTTLPIKKPSIFARLLALGKSASDAACIAEAIEDSRTSTQLPGRGHGLGNIINVVSTIRNGVVMVMSNRGCYIMKQEGFTTKSDYRESILGTLIFWRVPVNGAADGT